MITALPVNARSDRLGHPSEFQTSDSFPQAIICLMSDIVYAYTTQIIR